MILQVAQCVWAKYAKIRDPMCWWIHDTVWYNARIQFSVEYANSRVFLRILPRIVTYFKRVLNESEQNTRHLWWFVNRVRNTDDSLSFSDKVSAFFWYCKWPLTVHNQPTKNLLYTKCYVGTFSTVSFSQVVEHRAQMRRPPIACLKNHKEFVACTVSAQWPTTACRCDLAGMRVCANKGAGNIFFCNCIPAWRREEPQDAVTFLGAPWVKLHTCFAAAALERCLPRWNARMWGRAQLNKFKVVILPSFSMLFFGCSSSSIFISIVFMSIGDRPPFSCASCASEDAASLDVPLLWVDWLVDPFAESFALDFIPGMMAVLQVG